MATFEQNTNETIEKIIRNLDTMTKSIVDLYEKIEELNKSIEKIKELTVNEVKEAQTEPVEVTCDFCGGSGLIMVDKGLWEYPRPCTKCKGTGKIKPLEVKGE